MSIMIAIISAVACIIYIKIKNNESNKSDDLNADDINKMRDYFNSIDDDERAEIIKIVKEESAREYKKAIREEAAAWAYIINNMNK